MTRGQESPSHKAMFEAFELRLRTCFPGSKITLGKKIQPVGLKPDIYVEHPDGRRWAFEMIYRNAHARHLLENHERYDSAGIRDFWILWDTLAPAVSRPPADQGVLTDYLHTRKRAKNTKLLQAVAQIHHEHCGVWPTPVYAFSFQEFGSMIENPHPIMQAISTGVTAYLIEEIAQTAKTLYYSTEYVPIVELGFDNDGFIDITIPDAETDELQINMLRKLGLVETSEHFPHKMLENLSQMMFKMPTKAQEKEFVELQGKILVESASPQDILELQEFVASGGVEKLRELMSSIAPSISASASMQNAEGLQAITQIVLGLQQALDQVGAPDSVRKMFLGPLNPGLLNGVTEVLTWQETSEAAQNLQKKVSE
jgi:hypothetical protein